MYSGVGSRGIRDTSRVTTLPVPPGGNVLQVRFADGPDGVDVSGAAVVFGEVYKTILSV